LKRIDPQNLEGESPFHRCYLKEGYPIKQGPKRGEMSRLVALCYLLAHLCNPWKWKGIFEGEGLFPLFSVPFGTFREAHIPGNYWWEKRGNEKINLWF